MSRPTEDLTGVFEHAPVALAECDLSRVRAALSERDLDAEAVERLPERELRALFTLARPLRINRAAQTLFETRSARAAMDAWFGAASALPLAAVRALLRAVAAGEPGGEIEVVRPPERGRAQHLEARWSVSPEHVYDCSRVLVVVNDITPLRAEQRRAAGLEEVLRRVSGRAELYARRERERLARELHDEVGALLTALNLDLAWLRRRAGGEELTTRLASAQDTVAATMSRLDRVLASLRTGESFTLAGAIQRRALEFEERTGIATDVRCADLAAIDDRVEHELQRILQEALTNVARHAGAGRVQVGVDLEGDGLVLTVRDDGRGLPAGPPPARRGIPGMRERARLLGGSLEIGPHPDGGVVLRARLPLAVPR